MIEGMIFLGGAWLFMSIWSVFTRPVNPLPWEKR